MEIFELKYFLAVARLENIHRASEKIRISPASLSKAIDRLEVELGVNLFHREGRHIRLTSQGTALRDRAAQILQLEEDARIEIAGQRGHHQPLQIRISGPEVLLSKMGLEICKNLAKEYPMASFELIAIDEEKAQEQLFYGETHLAVLTGEVVGKYKLSSKVLEEVWFQTCVGEGHPLFDAAKTKRVLNIKEVLRHPFVSPSLPLLGKVGIRQSSDGWRDDEFPRKVVYLTSSLKIIEEVVTSGKALAYLPNYFCEGLPVEILKISGCPYTCVQKVKIAAKNPRDKGWLNRLF